MKMCAAMTPTNDSRRFVVLSGLPGSGKTWLARQLAPALNLRLFDKMTSSSGCSSRRASVTPHGAGRS
jgi:tRNA A37 threonylcarbamoyladenosine biosynthesis protein TsaE